MRLADAFVAEADEGATHILEPSVRMLRAAMLSAGGEAVKASGEIEAALAQVRQTNDQNGQTGARAAFGLLAEGRSEEASELLSGVLELGERMIPVLNDSPIVDGAWVAHDLGRGEEYLTRIEQTGRTGAWAEAAAAICASDFLAAAETCREIGYRPGEAYARLRTARELVEEGRRAEADAELQRAVGFWREVGAVRYVREGEALLAASA
jgi:thioredoxin-like negative regulator of GroEL